jgi:phage FluMu protein Com
MNVALFVMEVGKMTNELISIRCIKCDMIIAYAEGDLYKNNTWSLRCLRCIKVIDR